MNHDTGSVSGETVLIEGPTDDGRRRRRLIIVAVVAVLTIVAAAMLLTRSGDPAPSASSAADQAPRVTVIVPGRASVDRAVTATGTLAARREMPVGVAGEGGMVTAVLVEPGQWVRAGQVLVIPSNVPHMAEALEDTLDVDVFSPPRQDWLDGSDAYLRQK